MSPIASVPPLKSHVPGSCHPLEGREGLRAVWRHLFPHGRYTPVDVGTARDLTCNFLVNEHFM